MGAGDAAEMFCGCARDADCRAGWCEVAAKKCIRPLCPSCMLSGAELSVQDSVTLPLPIPTGGGWTRARATTTATRASATARRASASAPTTRSAPRAAGGGHWGAENALALTERDSDTIQNGQEENILK